MFLRRKLSVAGLAFGLVTFGGIALGQQTQSSVQNPAAGVQQTRRAAMARRVMQRRARQPMFRVLRQFNLSDQQKHQVRSIIQTNLQSTKVQRRELRQLTRQWRQGTLTPEGLARAGELRKELREGRKTVRVQLAGILTPEQKTKLEEMIKARRANQGVQTPGSEP